MALCQASSHQRHTHSRLKVATLLWGVWESEQRRLHFGVRAATATHSAHSSAGDGDDEGGNTGREAEGRRDCALRARVRAWSGPWHMRQRRFSLPYTYSSSSSSCGTTATVHPLHFALSAALISTSISCSDHHGEPAVPQQVPVRRCSSTDRIISETWSHWIRSEMGLDQDPCVQSCSTGTSRLKLSKALQKCKVAWWDHTCQCVPGLPSRWCGGPGSVPSRRRRGCQSLPARLRSLRSAAGQGCQSDSLGQNCERLRCTRVRWVGR